MSPLQWKVTSTASELREPSWWELLDNPASMNVFMVLSVKGKRQADLENRTSFSFEDLTVDRTSRQRHMVWDTRGPSHRSCIGPG